MFLPVGILLYEFLVGRPPFEVPNGTAKATYEKISKVDYTIPKTVSPEAADLIDRLLRYKAEDRLSLDAVMVHPWIKKNFRPL